MHRSLHSEIMVLTRRILAIGLGFGVTGVLAYLALEGNEVALGAMISTGVAIVTFYFTSGD